MLDLLLVASLGFLGSFGHCVGMCSPIAVAFSLSQKPQSSTFWKQAQFHLWLNLGRILSYALVGAGIGLLGSVLLASGQLAGIGSPFRRIMSLVTGGMLIWLGLTQVKPGWLPSLPVLNPMAQRSLHDRLDRAMVNMSLQSRWWTPALLGMTWGLIPCGFLYTAQIKAAETGELWRGGLTMLAFGLGTVPAMWSVGVSASALSRDRRSQLFRLGGWITIAIGVLTLLRTGDTMVDYTGHAALLCLMLALIARPMSRIWSAPLQVRRALGVGAFVLSVAHLLHMVEHSWGWNLRAIGFMLPQHQWGIGLGGMGFVCMIPAALTSFDWAQKRLGSLWRSIHLLSVPALLLCTAHCILVGSHYLGRLQPTEWNWGCTIGLVAIVLGVLLLRTQWLWFRLGLESYYVPPRLGLGLTKRADDGCGHGANLLSKSRTEEQK
ncbi:urease accessory protein UreH domain-containing protein [Thermocoleostomius sinensis]|uniref:Sulfite exporter TauE/SafE family protein n=1 Tax=Thermocoleostomius sinensis A174 TaxID=2016057 RepID=A0A9E9C942_9CYAN|nr:sulfite exporter TauE/SafE family protein [Thermocoleostomius sinensis]WAL62149.1 sulfite exporter TauE/SafE family protein [Thermocoleostomius sinensis A174]